VAQGRPRHRLQGRQLALLLSALVGWAPQPALADAREGQAFLKQNLVREAREEFERGAAKGEPASLAMLTFFLWYGFDQPPQRTKACWQAGEPALAKESMAQAILAHCHLTGTGMPRDVQKARTLARPAALEGNNEARFVNYLTVLAERPVGSRGTEIEAIDMLARAAQTGHRDSQIALAGYFYATVGEGNRARARTLYSQVPNLPESAARARDSLAEVERIAGQSPLTVRMLRDTQATAIAVAIKAGASGDCKDIRLMSTTAAGPIQDASYLPNTHPWVARTYMVRGNWEEDWRYEFCGKEFAVRMRFEADGKSGAYFRPGQAP